MTEAALERNPTLRRELVKMTREMRIGLRDFEYLTHLWNEEIEFGIENNLLEQIKHYGVGVIMLMVSLDKIMLITNHLQFKLVHHHGHL